MITFKPITTEKINIYLGIPSMGNQTMLATTATRAEQLNWALKKESNFFLDLINVIKTLILS